MAANRKRESKGEPIELQDDINSYEIHATEQDPCAVPPEVLLRIEEVKGVPSPTEGVTTDLYWQLDLATKRATGHPRNIVGVKDALSCEGRFHEDFVIRRVNPEEPLLLTLRSSALGNGCFGKILLDVDKDLLEGRVGAVGETLSIQWLKLQAYFKSNDSSVAYDMQVRVIAKAILPKSKPQAPSVTPMANQALYILTDPKGTLPGVPITALLFLHRTAAAERIAKGSLRIDTIGEAKVLVSGKIGKRRSFWSSGEAASHVYTGVSAIMDSEAGLLERDAQELLQKATSNGSASSPAPPKPSLAELSRSPRASQRASQLFRGAPKATEFDSVSTTYCWRIQLPVPNVSENATLPASCCFANDNTDIFGELGKTTEVAFGVRHVVNARCGIMTPAQTPFVVHALGVSSDVAPASLTPVDESCGVTADAILEIDSSSPENVQKTIHIVVQPSRVKIHTLTVSVYGSINLANNAGQGNEWKAFEHKFDLSRTGPTLSKKLNSSVFGPPTITGLFLTSYFIEMLADTNTGHIKFVRSPLPVREVLAEELASLDQAKLAGAEIDTLHMRSSVVDAPFIAIPAINPHDSVTLYSESGEPISFDEIAGSVASGGSRRPKRKSKAKSKEDIIQSSNTPLGDNLSSEIAVAPASPTSKRKSRKTEAV